MTRQLPYDPGIEPALRAYLASGPRPEPAARALIDAAIRGTTVTAEDRLVARPAGSEPVLVTVFRDERYRGQRLPVLYYLHGGGLVAGTRGRVAGLLTPLAAAGAACVTVEYGLAPAHSFGAALADCYTALCALEDLAGEFAFDLEQVVVGGASAGGGLAAALAVLARDRGHPRITGQLLESPMLDDQGNGVSTDQYASEGVWSRDQNRDAWSASLGGDPSATRYVPARVADLGGLPPAYLSVGSAELFRDEVVTYASAIWRDGGAAELHVWPGACHAFEALAPGSDPARSARRSREDWLMRVGVLPVAGFPTPDR